MTIVIENWSRRMRHLFLLICAMSVSGAALAHGISEEARQRMIDGGNLEYLRLGAEHMITGYDHLLFLFGVMFFLTRLVDIVKFVTAFTIGHTIALIFATYLKITADYYLVDAFIALTVAYKGFENLDGFRKYLNTASPNLLAMVFAFGLVHGFGLSTRLQQLPVAEGGGILMHILSFNLGVELGQIAALLVMWAVLRIWRQRSHFTVFSKVANAGLIFAGALLLFMQLHGFSHTAYADDFPISRDDHAHAHLEASNQPQAPADSVSAEVAAHGHAHNPDGSHVLPQDEAAHGHAHNPDGSHGLPQDEGASGGHSHGPGSDHTHDAQRGHGGNVPPHD